MKRADNVDAKLDDIQHFLVKHQLVGGAIQKRAIQRQGLAENMAHLQNLHQLEDKLNQLHPADYAMLLEQLPLPERLIVWGLVRTGYDGEVLLELTDAVRLSLIENMDAAELLGATEQLDTDEIADLVPDLPRNVIANVFKSLPTEEREHLKAALSYSQDSVGALMNFDMVTVPEDITLEIVLTKLRALDELPENTDQLFVLDYSGGLRGVLPINRLIVSDLNKMVSQIMDNAPVSFAVDDKANQAAVAFDKYDLVSAPVLDENGRVAGRLTVADIVDFMRDEEDSENLGKVGLRDEDLFATVWRSARNRWLWLGVNLSTAVIASRAISLFEDSIEKLVALAALMPIVTAVAGNTGNQTITLIVRAIAFGDITRSNVGRLFIKELSVGLLNGFIWGGIAGVFTWWLYDQVALGLVMTGAMILNLLVAAAVGMLVPLGLYKIGRDPAIGSAVLLGFTTDSMGFIIFLGLATIILV